VHDVTVIHPSTSGSRMGTIESTPAGVRVVMRASSGRAVVFAHAAGAPLGSWTSGSAGMSVNYPSAAALDDGGLVVATESDATNHVSSVQRFSPSGAPAPVELALSGYLDPTVASDGTRIWLLAVRLADGFVVSREFSPSTGWTTADRVEIGAEGGGNHRWVNPIRHVDGRLSFVVRGPRGSTSNSASAVLAFQRPV
jgi:hypothetical protein